ncbi:MAG TPA: ABC transporter ATP-binding protein [Tissierellia bacterium]|nr:ABC transporter ATP-binding protein [Tissierellia bacterium]
MSLLELRDVTKQFGGLVAVGDVSLTVEQGSIHGLIGPNGAGKTTLFNLITGIYGLSGGTILFEREPIDGLAPFRIAQKGITRTFQNIRLFKDLSVYDNVLTACHMNTKYSVVEALFRLPARNQGEKKLKQETEILLDIMNLTDRRDVSAGNLPYGFQRRLEIARAVALKPTLLLLDEPAAGMNPDETFELLEMIKQVKREFGLTVLIIEHHMDLIMNLCDRIMVLNFGRVLAEGSPIEIQNDPAVVQAYLGEGGNHDARY